MTWTRLDQDFAHHPKIVAAGERAELLHIHALLYCNRFLTDGLVPDSVLPTLTRHARADVDRLIKLGIWVPVEEGYQIHDFLEYQPSRASVLAKRKQRASSGQAGGLARARGLLQHPANPVSVPVPGSKEPSLETKHVGRTDLGRSQTNRGLEHVGDLLADMPAFKVSAQ